MGNITGPTLLTSSDDAQSWQAFDVNCASWGTLIAFGILPDDRLLILFEPAGAGDRAVWCGQSNDGGETWCVTQSRLDLGLFTRVLGKDANPVFLADNRLLVALQLWDDESEEGKKGASAYAFVSDDVGGTWERRGLIAKPVRHTSVVRTASGSLLACCYDPNAQQILLSTSNDGSETWSPPRPVNVSDPGPADLTKLVDGTLLLNFLFKYDPDREHTAHGVRAVISRDDGKTWSADQYVIAHWGEGGYGGYLPSHFALSDGRLITARVTTVDNGLRMQAVKWKPMLLSE